MATILTTTAIPNMTSNTVPSGIVSTSNEYGVNYAWNAFNNSTSYWQSSNTLPTWIAYEFNSPKLIIKYSIKGVNTSFTPKDWTFEGWNGANWIVLDTRINVTNWDSLAYEYQFINSISYKKYRINISAINNTGKNVAIKELSMFEIIYDNKILISSGNGFLKIKKGASKTYTSDTVIPTMTSGVSSIGTSFSSSFRASSQESWRAFDKNPIYAWISLQNSPITTPEWIGFNFNNPIKIEKYRVATSGRFSTPKDFIFQGSIDGVLWDDLDYQTISKATWTSKSNLIEFPFYNNKEYKQYRLYIISDEKSDSVGVVIDQLDMFTVDKEEVLPSISIVSTSTEQNFINHGMDKPIELDVASTISSRTFVEQSPTTLGSGKVFKKSIDTSQVPIKKVTIK